MYSMFFNQKYKLTGHLFQGRYYAELIDTESYLLQSSKYIHLNPVKAGIVKKPIQYPWSSYGVFMGVEGNELIYDEGVLRCIQGSSRKLYKEYVESEENDDVVPGTMN